MQISVNRTQRRNRAGGVLRLGLLGLVQDPIEAAFFPPEFLCVSGDKKKGGGATRNERGSGFITNRAESEKKILKNYKFYL